MLLVYLAFQQDWIKRDELAFFLRPDADKETGQQYLRKLISNARKFPWAQSLEVEAERLRWRTDTDIKQFRSARQRGSWKEATKLYRGPLMGKEEVPYLPSYNSWLQIERESIDFEWRDVSSRYIYLLENSNQHFEAASLATKLLKTDPFDEAALQSFLRATYLMGYRERALKAARDFQTNLEAELGLDVTHATHQLIEAIRASKPVETPKSPIRYGRRRGDVVKVAEFKGQTEELINLLGLPGSRLVSVNPTTNDEATITISVRVGKISTVLLSIIELAAQLIDKHHTVRALELLLLVLNHPACDTHIKAEAYKVWPGLGRLTHND